MTFVLDRTRSFLKIEEPNLLSLHRSTHPLAPSAEYCHGHPCDAFICVANEYNLHRVYVALHDQQMKSNLVFVSDPVRPDAEKIAALVTDARAFLENIGFEMDAVNINFSTATREVIIKDIRVMREPSPALQLEAAKAALAAMVAEKEEIALKASSEQMKLAAEVADLRKRLDAAAAVQQATLSEAVPAETAKEEGERELRRVSAENELHKVREEFGSVNATLKSTAENLKHAKDEARQARKEQKQYRHENEALQEKLLAGRTALDTARNEIEVVRRELHEAGEKYKAALREKEAHNDAVEAARLVELKEELQRLRVELAGTDVTYSGEVELLRAALAEANAALSAEKAKNESALLEMDALERNASGALKVLNKKVDTLTAEKQLLEKIATEIKNKARGEIERQQQINRVQRTAALQKLQALQEEIRQLAEARAAISSPTGVALMATGTKALQADAGSATSFSAQVPGFSSDPFGSYEGAGSCAFLPDTSLKGIPYADPGNVVEVYRSYNTIQAAPSGRKAERCNGFVCVMTEGGRSQVYVAWVMNTSGDILVCLPDRAADSGDSCQRMLREGINYFERIGFMIDRLPLEADPDRRRIQLDGLDIFCRTVTECAA